MIIVELIKNNTTEQELIDKIANIFSCDEDFNGNNGLEFTSQLAIEEGFKSDLEYYTHKAIKEHGNKTEEVMNTVLKGFRYLNDNHYEISTEMEKTDKGLLFGMHLRLY